MMTAAAPLDIRESVREDLPWITEELTRHWGGTSICSLGRWYAAVALPGLIADIDGERAGLLTYHTDERGMEIITLSSRSERCGVGTALLRRIVEHARAVGSRRLFLTTTNDNLQALGFYQRRGWKLVAVHAGAMDRARAQKPAIPVIGLNSIPLRDEIELEYPLQATGLTAG